MKRHLLLILTVLGTLPCFAQIDFEPGYFIDEDGQQTTCLIKNADWQHNPSRFEYKLSESASTQEADISFVKEFGIDNFSKFIRARVQIDRSSDKLGALTNDRNPIFEEKQLFLAVLIEGKSTLYRYKELELERYFYRVGEAPIEQLIYKKFITGNNSIGENNGFRGQIWNDVSCPEMKREEIERLRFLRKELVRIFITYNECQATEFINFEAKQQRDKAYISIRPRLNYASMTTQNTNLLGEEKIIFENKLGIGVGLEAEFVLPFNKDKWALLVEPTFQRFHSSGRITDVPTIFGGEINATYQYISMEVPMGIRHYFYLNDDSNLFVNASYVLDLTLQALLEGTLFNGNSAFSPTEKSASSENFAFGLGYKKFDKYSLEMRYQTDRTVIANLYTPTWSSDFGSFSLIFGYRLY